MILSTLLLTLAPAWASVPASYLPEVSLPGSPATAGQSGLEGASGGPASTGAVGTVKRPMKMELGFRARYLFVPDSILDIWYFNSDDPGANPYDRPKVRAYSVGVEFALKPQPTNWIFYAEYIGANVEDGYWDDVESPANHDDGDWIVFDRFSMVTLGANYGHEVAVSSTEKPVWLSMVFGGGLGVGVVTGGLTQWHNGTNSENTAPDCLPDSSAYERKDACPNDGKKRVPPVVPIVDITYSLRLNLADHASLRFDAGLHDLIYLGGSFAGVF